MTGVTSGRTTAGLSGRRGRTAAAATATSSTAGTRRTTETLARLAPGHTLTSIACVSQPRACGILIVHMLTAQHRFEPPETQPQVAPPYDRRVFLGLLAGAAFWAVQGGRSWAATGLERALTVRVRLTEFKVAPSTRRGPAGKITFVVRNAGTLDHDFVVLRTNVAPGALPMAGARAKEVGRKGRIPVFGPGKTRRLTLDLKPGKYVLICNVPGHYKAGMFIGFRVV